MPEKPGGGGLKDKLLAFAKAKKAQKALPLLKRSL